MIHVTFISNGNKTVEAAENSNLLRISLREQGGIPFKCGGGLCGTCKCRIEAGIENTDAIKDKERRHLTAADFANGFRMACQTFVTGNVSVSWQPRPKAGGERTANAPAANGAPSAAAPSSSPAVVATAAAESLRAFSSLSAESRARMLAIGPKWAADITGHRRMVLDAYAPVLAARPDGGIEAIRDIAYGDHPRQRLDVYRQAGLEDAPVVVFIHGGAFVRGDKDANDQVYSNVARHFARHGCVGINVEYRLAPAAAYPAGAVDVGLAVAWARAHAREHGGDPSRIVLFGHSAGGAHAGAYVCDPAARPAAGHGLAGLILVSSRLRADALPDNPNAKAVCAYYGDDASRYDMRSVTTHVDALDIPVFLACAQFENPYLDAYTAEFAYRVGMARGRMPRLMHLMGHNHTSIVGHLDSGEDELGDALLDFVRDPR